MNHFSASSKIFPHFKSRVTWDGLSLSLWVTMEKTATTPVLKIRQGRALILEKRKTSERILEFLWLFSKAHPYLWYNGRCQTEERLDSGKTEESGGCRTNFQRGDTTQKNEVEKMMCEPTGVLTLQTLSECAWSEARTFQETEMEKAETQAHISWHGIFFFLPTEEFSSGSSNDKILS